MAVILTLKAVEKIKEAINKVGDPIAVKGVRVGVAGGGCSGFQYTIELESNDADPANDEIYEYDGLKVFVDKKSALYLAGMTIDYLESLAKSGFVFNNPNAQKSCGCGESFSV